MKATLGNPNGIVGRHLFKILPLALAAVQFSIGCGRGQAPPKPVPTPVVVNPDEPAVPFVPLKASFVSLGAEPDLKNDVQWAAALTLAEISAIAYEKPELQEVMLTDLGAKKVFSFEVGSSAGLVASDDQSIVIAFRGTQSWADKLTDIKVFGKKVQDGKMHRGFFGAVEAVYDKAVKGAEDQHASQNAYGSRATVWAALWQQHSRLKSLTRRSCVPKEL